jgi:hypothetical protein
MKRLIAPKPTVAVIAALACACAAAPSMASAADRYAEPTGDGAEPCAQIDPCDLVTAINDSTSGDDITLLSGTYSTSTTLGGGGAFSRTIHGAPGARPTINFTAASGGQNGILLQAGSTIRDVVIESTAGNGGSALFLGGGTIERVTVHETGAHASGPDTRACAFNPDTVIRDSVCWYSGAGGSNADAIQAQSPFPAGTATLRNVTAIAANAPAIRVVAFGNISGPAEMDLAATNVIARGGGSAGQEDVKTIFVSGAVSATATFDHSNYATESEQNSGDITDPNTGTNTNVAPDFVSTASGDFHEKSTSTGTLNLGTATGVDAMERDLDGQARVMGSEPDIGADELEEAPPAPAFTGSDPPSGSNENSPLLIGTAAPFSLVHVFASTDCSGSETGAEAAEEFASPGILVSVPDNSTTSFSANAVNDVGTSPCSAPISYAEVTPPPAPPIPPAGGSLPSPQPTQPSAPASKKCKKKKKKHRAASVAKKKKCKKKKR